MVVASFAAAAAAQVVVAAAAAAAVAAAAAAAVHVRQSERCLPGVRGRTSKLIIYLHLNIGSPCGPGSWPG